jgi:hypothetical protein
MLNGYCFLDECHYHPPENLKGVEGAILFILKNRNKFVRLLVTDEADSTVIEVINGEVVFPMEIARIIGGMDSINEPQKS